MVLLLTRLGLFQSKEIDKRPDENSGKALIELSAKGSKNKSWFPFLAHSLGEGRGDQVPCMGGGSCTICPPPGGAGYAGTTPHPALLQQLRRGSWVFWSFCIFLSIINLAAHARSYFLMVSLYFVAPEDETFVQVRALQQKAQAPGPRLSQCRCKDRCISSKDKNVPRNRHTEAGSIDCQQRYQSNSMGKDSLFSKQH